MNAKTFDAFRSIIYDKSGISINANKVALVSARIGKRMRELGIADSNDYLEHLMQDQTGEEIVNLLDVISTNVTSFYREAAHFEFLGNVLDKWKSEGRKRLRLWCAASSSGEEPYTIAMTVLEHLGAGFDARILATDISTRILSRARAGVYPADKLEAVPARLRSRYFTECESGRGPALRAGEALRALVSFGRLNLSTPPFPMQGPFDAVFCRNVMIYFDNAVRKRLLDDIYRLVCPGGYLFVGHAESLTGMLSGFRSVMPSVYIRGE